MSIARVATLAEESLNGLNTPTKATLTGGPTHSAQTIADATTTAGHNTSGVGDSMTGVASVLGQTDNLFSWAGYFQALAVLFLIIAVLFTALWFLRRKGGIRLLSSQGDLFVESRMVLGPRKQLIVVRFLNKRVLLGVTDQQITMLTELPTDDNHTTHNNPTPPNVADFKAHLANAAQTEPENSG